MFTALLSIVLAYTGTAMDDLFVLMLLFTQADDMSRRKRILQGQCLGIGVLVAISLLGAAGLDLLPDWSVGLMGLIPITLGIREAIVSAKPDKEAAAPTAASMLRVALLAIAGGADNIGVYAPLFAGFDMAGRMLAVLLFAALTVLWCALAALIAAQPQLRTILQKHKRILVPAVLIALGAYILLTNLLPLWAR